MFTSSYRQVLTIGLILVMSVGALGVANASDAAKYLLGAAVGVLAYKALDDGGRYDNHCDRAPYVRADQPWDAHRNYNPPPNFGFYAPSPQAVYDQGYKDGWKDGKQYGERKGFAKGYDVGYDRGYGRGYANGATDDEGRHWAGAVRRGWDR